MYENEDGIEYSEEKCTIGGFSFMITTVEFLPIEQLMLMHAEDKEISGRKIWCGSLVVAEYLSKNKEYVQNHAIIELGAGTGLLGMFSSRLGAKSVYLTDHDTICMDIMKRDCLANEVSAQVTLLDWFQPDTSIWNDCIDIRVLAGDVLYKSTLIEPFMNTVELLLRNKGSRMLLCHVPRAGVTHDLIIQAACNNGILLVPIEKEKWYNESLKLHCNEEEISTAGLYELSVV